MKKSLLLYLLSLVIGLASAYFLPQVINNGVDETNKIFLLLGLLSSAIFGALGIYIDYKERQSAKILKIAATKDSIWDFEQMKIQVRSTLYRMDTAWRDKDASALENYLTQECYLKFRDEINNSSGEDRKYSGPLSIDETRIICCQDYLNNEEDKFVAYIKGTEADGDTTRGFAALLYFSRQGNDWLLYKIHHGMGVWDLLSTRNVEEA